MSTNLIIPVVCDSKIAPIAKLEDVDVQLLTWAVGKVEIKNLVDDLAVGNAYFGQMKRWTELAKEVFKTRMAASEPKNRGDTVVVNGSRYYVNWSKEGRSKLDTEAIEKDHGTAFLTKYTVETENTVMRIKEMGK